MPAPRTVSATALAQVRADPSPQAWSGAAGSGATGPVVPVNNVFTRYSLHGRMRYRPLPLKRPETGVNGDDARFD